jgi:hypothetical protein
MEIGVIRLAVLVALAALGLVLSGGAGCARTGDEAVPPGAQPPAPAAPSPLAFDTYGGYFVSNKFEAGVEASFVVLHDQRAFDAVFGAAFVMRDKSHRLPAGAFDTKIILAAIHRGKALWEYAVEGVRADGGVVTLRYTATPKPSESAEYACPLIVSIEKGAYTAVQFVENGKPAKRIEISPAAGK